jgi:HSP20 family protein
MTLEPWDPWSELERARSEADRMLGAFLEKLRKALPGEAIAFVPVLDLVETPLEFRLYVSVPGIVEDDVDLTLEEGWLIIRGEREAPFDSSARRLLAEWKYGFFERRVRLPAAADSEAISAGFDAGVLSVIIPKKRS